MSMLLFVLHELWSIIDDSGFVVSSVVSSHPALLSFHMLAGNLDRARALHVMLFLENLMRALLIFNGLRSVIASEHYLYITTPVVGDFLDRTKALESITQAIERYRQHRHTLVHAHRQDGAYIEQLAASGARAVSPHCCPGMDLREGNMMSTSPLSN